MKTSQLICNVFTVAALIGFLSACASDNYKQSSDTATTLAQSAGMISRCNVLIDQTLADLNDLVSNSVPDLRVPFHKFGKDVDELGVSAVDLAKKANQMKIQGADYFAQWDKELAQIQNEDIRSRSEARKNEVASRFNRISEHYDEANSALVPFMSDLRDVQKALSTDLTVGGISAIKDTAAKANHDATAVQESLGKLSEEFRSLGLSMSPIDTSK
jgi:hypothetical protein